MLINLINKITIFDEKIEVRYRIRFDNFIENHYNNTDGDSYAGGGNYDDSGELCLAGVQSDLSLCQEFAQRETLAKI